MKKKLMLSLSTLFILILGCQRQSVMSVSKSKTESLTHESIKLETDKIFDKLVKIRRQLHENPELAGKEKQTQETIKQYLLGLGLDVKTDIYGHGLVGILKGDKKGKAIAWRTDMDALAHDFPEKVDFKSKVKGVQHGCGHDVHMAVALGIAEVLARHKKDVQGTIYFIFQPEEETFGGAKGMVDKGLFSQIKPDEIYGLHVSALQVGQIMAKSNEIFAYQKRVRIKLKNSVSNEAAMGLSKKIQSALIRIQDGAKPWEVQHIVDPKLGIANPNTIFKDYLIMDENFYIYTDNNELFMEAYLFETNAANLPNIIPTIRKTIETNGYKDDVLSISFIQDNPTVVNDEKLTTAAAETLKNIYGNDLIVKGFGQVPYFNDDFTLF
jgi:hypothetical protein